MSEINIGESSFGMFNNYSDETPQTIAERLHEGKIHSEITSTDKQILHRQAEIESLQNEISQLRADKNILCEALNLARDKGIE